MVFKTGCCVGMDARKLSEKLLGYPSSSSSSRKKPAAVSKDADVFGQFAPDAVDETSSAIAKKHYGENPKKKSRTLKSKLWNATGAMAVFGLAYALIAIPFLGV